MKLNQIQPIGRFMQVILLSFMILVWGALSTNSQSTNVDVEIVLAVDASGSINKSELQIQLDGIAAAFRDKTLVSAVTSGPHQRVAVSLLIWSDAAYSKVPTKWHIIATSTDAEFFAKTIEGFGKQFRGFYFLRGGGTGLGDGLAYAVNMIKRNDIHAIRRIVDVSGDGIETPPWSEGAIELPEARIMARLQNITVNGLTILTDIENLDEWYRNNVILGPGSFVVEVREINDYGRAIKMKLLREFTNRVAKTRPDHQRRYACKPLFSPVAQC